MARFFIVFVYSKKKKSKRRWLPSSFSFWDVIFLKRLSPFLWASTSSIPWWLLCPPKNEHGWSKDDQRCKRLNLFRSIFSFWLKGACPLPYKLCKPCMSQKKAFSHLCFGWVGLMCLFSNPKLVCLKTRTPPCKLVVFQGFLTCYTTGIWGIKVIQPASEADRFLCVVFVSLRHGWLVGGSKGFVDAVCMFLMV